MLKSNICDQWDNMPNISMPDRVHMSLKTTLLLRGSIQHWMRGNGIRLSAVSMPLT